MQRFLKGIWSTFISMFYFLWSMGGLLGAIISATKHDILAVILSLVVPFYGFYVLIKEVIQRFF